MKVLVDMMDGTSRTFENVVLVTVRGTWIHIEYGYALFDRVLRSKAIKVTTILN